MDEKTFDAIWGREIAFHMQRPVGYKGQWPPPAPRRCLLDRFLLLGPLTVYLEPRDLWIGAYVSRNYVYVCPVPILVFRFRRAS